MTLQYRPDTDRLLYLPGEDPEDPLMGECCCELEEEEDNIKFDACCDAPFDDLEEYPHFIVIGPTRYAALGNPAVVVYGDPPCCYGRASPPETDYPVNVNEPDVTASSESSCDECNLSEGSDCVYCSRCNDCDPVLGLEYTLTFDAALWWCNPESLVDSLLDPVVVRWHEGCLWRKINFSGYVFPLRDIRRVELYWSGSRWYVNLVFRIGFVGNSTENYMQCPIEHTHRLIFSGSEDPCSPIGAYELESVYADGLIVQINAGEIGEVGVVVS